MVKHEVVLDRVFSALADPTRRAILLRLREGESRVTDLARPFRMSLPAVSKHLRVLEKAGLLLRKKSGRVHRLRANPDALRQAQEWMERYGEFWEQHFDALDRFLAKDSTKKKE